MMRGNTGRLLSALLNRFGTMPMHGFNETPCIGTPYRGSLCTMLFTMADSASVQKKLGALPEEEFNLGHAYVSELAVHQHAVGDGKQLVEICALVVEND